MEGIGNKCESIKQIRIAQPGKEEEELNCPTIIVLLNKQLSEDIFLNKMLVRIEALELEGNSELH